MSDPPFVAGKRSDRSAEKYPTIAAIIATRAQVRWLRVPGFLSKVLIGFNAEIKSGTEQIKQGCSEPGAPRAEMMLRTLVSDRAKIVAFAKALCL